MGGFFNALYTVVIIFMIMSIGWLLGHLGWLTAAEKKFISKYVVNIAIPANCVTKVLSSFDRAELIKSGSMVFVASIVVGLCMVISAVVGKLLKLPRERWGVFVVMGGISNTMMIGIPVVDQLFGDPGTPYLMMYYLFSAIYTQTVAVMLCEYAGGKGGGEKMSLFGVLKAFVKKPPVIGIMFSFAMLLLDLRLPDILMRAGDYVADTVTPLALIYSGFIIYEVGLRNLRFLPGLGSILVIRLILSPVICWGVCLLMGITGLARDVFVVMSALPVITQVPVFAGLYGADEQYGALGACLSMIGMFITLPVIMLILS